MTSNNHNTKEDKMISFYELWVQWMASGHIITIADGDHEDWQGNRVTIHNGKVIGVVKKG